MQWDHERFGKWLKYQRTIEHNMSQDKLAEKIGVAQAYISRWERGWENYPNTPPPELETCLDLAEMFETDFIDLAKLCRRWNDRLEKRIRMDLASSDGQQSKEERPGSWLLPS